MSKISHKISNGVNHQNETMNAISSLSGSKIIRASSFIFIAAAFLVSGFFAPQQAFAAAIATPASGGANISIDTTSATGGSNISTGLEGPAITENVAGDIAAGTHTITLPSGWEFNTGSNITITKVGSIVLGSSIVIPGQTSFSFVVSSQSTSASVLFFSGLQVKPIGTAPSAGNMTYSGAGIAGVDGSTNFGTLSTVAGTVTKLVFTTQPGNAVYGSLLNPQPVVKTQDQFGNNSTSGLGATEIVSLTLTGTGALVGDATLDIGTGAATPGTVTFTDLKVGGVGAVGTKGLTASAGILTNAVSGPFVISQKPITATVTVNNKPYDGNNSAVITDVTLNDVEPGDNVTVNNQGTAIFASSNANTSIVVTSNGVIITGTHVGNYSFGGTATGVANITPLEITITPTAGQTKVYGQIDPTFAYTFTPALISPDTFSGALGRVAGGDVNTYAYTLGTLPTIGSNYTLTLVPGTFAITQRTLIVTATGVNKVYDANTTATVTLSDDRVSGDVLTLGYTATFTDSKNVGTGKPVSVTAITITGGAAAGNYTLGNTTTATTANITAKPLTVSFTTYVDKTYDGDNSANITGRTLDGIIGTEAVSVTGGSATFADKHIGLAKIVTATGFTLTGIDKDNYLIGTINTTTGNVNPRPITVTAVTDTKIYNGTTGSGGTPIVTSTFSPPVASGDTANFIQTYDNKNVGTGKTLTPSGVVIDGNPILEGSNYAVTFAPVSTGAITVKSINVTAQTDTKVYDGSTSSDEAPVVDALEIGDTVDTAPTQSFNTKDVGTSKTLTASGLVINDGNGGANYNIIYVNNGTGIINAKELTVVGATTIERVYDGGVIATVNFGPATLVGKIGTEDVTLNFGGYSATFNNKNVAIGKTVTVSGLVLAGAGASNYSLTQPVLNDGAITARTLTVTAVTNTKPYDGLLTAAATPTITAGALASGDAGTFTETYDNANVGTTHVLTPAGTIADAGNTNMTGNYDITFTAIATGVINKAPLTITADNKSKVYGSSNPALTASYVGFVNGETASVLDTQVSLSTTAVDASSVGAYSITASGATDANYTITFATGTLTVTPAPLTVTADAKSKTYGEDDPGLTHQITSGSLLGGDTLTGSLSRVSGENFGAYAIASTLAHPNYTITFVSANLTINKKPIIVTAVTNTKIYDGGISAAGTPTFTGSLVGTDTANFTEAYDNKDVGTSKTLTPSGIVNDGNLGNNYAYTFQVDTTGVITAKSITITPNAGQNKVYGQSDLTFTYTNTPALIGSDVFSGALGRVAGENVGTYEYELGSLTAGGNYTLTLTPGTFAITKATPEVTWDNLEDIVYGTELGEDQLNAETDVDGEFVYTPVSGTVLDAGEGQELSVTFTPTDTLNYESVTQEVVITVTPAPLTVTADNQTKEYGASDPDLTYEFSGLVSDDTDAVFSGTLEREPGEEVGEYDINKGELSAGSNYEIDFNSGTLTIEDTIAPTVVSHTPSFNALNISPTTAIVVTFSEAVDVEEEDVFFDPELSGGLTITNLETSVVTITPNNPLADNTTYTITLDGVADINGNPLPIYSNIKFTTATNYSINLNANASGWNLISLPVIPSNTAIAAVLGSAADNIDAVWTYDPTNPNAVNGWLVFVPGNTDTNNLTLMTAGFGYWVSVTGNANLSGSGTLLIAGPTSPPSRALQTGWNLIGYYQLPNENYSTPVSAFVSIGAPGVGYNGLWGFDNTTGFFNSVTTINPGDAFWISLPSAKTYTPSNL